MGFWAVLGIILGCCFVIRLFGSVFSEKPTVSFVICEILLIIELILLIKFKKYTNSMVLATVETEKEVLLQLDWIYILFILCTIMSVAPVIFDDDNVFLGTADSEVGTLFVFLLGDSQFLFVAILAAILGAIFVFAFTLITFLIVLLILDMLFLGYMIYSSICD